MSKLTITDLKRRINEVDALRLEAERQVGELREQLAKEAVWGRFAGWLLDHCEGQQIYEERLQYWLSEMLAHEKATSTEGKDHE